MGRTVIERLETRLAHLDRLDDPGLGRTVDLVNHALTQVHQDGPAPASILLRRRFLARSQWIYVSGDRDKTPRTKPALATLVAPKGLSLRLELTLLFLVQCRRRSSARIPLSLLPDPEDPDSLGLISLFSTGNQPRAGSMYKRGVTKMRTAQVTGALDTLQALGLVEMERTSEGRSDYSSRMWLNNEFGPLGADPQRYKLPPRASTNVVSIPIEFFTNGWIQVMTDSEIANWLMWRDVGQMRTAEVTSADDLCIDAELRLGTYDITRDAWDTHLMLDRFGLMSARQGDLHVGKTPNGSGFRREPHRFDLDDAPLKKPALPIVKSAVVRDLKDRLARRAGSAPPGNPSSSGNRSPSQAQGR